MKTLQTGTAIILTFLCLSQQACAFSSENYESNDISSLKLLLESNNYSQEYKEYIQGNIFFLEKDFTKAEQEYRKAMQKMPVYAPLYIKLAKVLEISGKNLDEAEELAIIALHAAKPKDFTGYLKTLASIRTNSAKNKYQNNIAVAKGN